MHISSINLTWLRKSHEINDHAVIKYVSKYVSEAAGAEVRLWASKQASKQVSKYAGR